MLLLLPFLVLPFLVVASPLKPRGISSSLVDGVGSSSLVESSDGLTGTTTLQQVATATSTTSFTDNSTATALTISSQEGNATDETPSFTLLPTTYTTSLACPYSSVDTGGEGSLALSHTGTDKTVTISILQPTESGTGNISKSQRPPVVVSRFVTSSKATALGGGGNVSTYYATFESSLPTTTVYATAASSTQPPGYGGCASPSNSSGYGSSTVTIEPSSVFDYNNASTTLIPSFALSATASTEATTVTSLEGSGGEPAFATSTFVGNI